MLHACGAGMFEARGVLPAALWMFVLGLLLGWLPFVGPAIAGLVGGLQAGGVTTALVAAIIPSILVAGAILLISTLLDIAWLGALLGIGAFMVLVFGSLPLLAGAWAGGALSERRGGTRQPR
jgi:hypothetical protein